MFLAPDGTLTLRADGAPPPTPLEAVEALSRAAEALASGGPRDEVLPAEVDSGAAPVLDASLGAAPPERTPSRLAALPLSLRSQCFDRLRLALGQLTPAGGGSGSAAGGGGAGAASTAATRPLDAADGLRLRSAVGTLLLELLRASPEPALSDAVLGELDALVRAEPDARLQEHLALQLSLVPPAPGARSTVEVAQALLATVTPASPPYEAWFKDGNRSLVVSWLTHPLFWRGFTGTLKQAGFEPLGPESQEGVSVYEKAYVDPQAGETRVRISVREGTQTILAPMRDEGVHLLGYKGHANWSRNVRASLRVAARREDGGEGRIVFTNLCAGKNSLDGLREKYPRAQFVTTYGASYYRPDADGQMKEGEGPKALLALLDGIAARADWRTLRTAMNRAANIGRGRTWEHFVTPLALVARARAADADDDGRADLIDEHLDTAPSVALGPPAAPPSASRARGAGIPAPPSSTQATKILTAANMVNMLSEFSGLLRSLNPDARVLAGGWHAARPGGEQPLVRYEPRRGADGRPEYVVTFDAAGAGLSEELLRAAAAYELNVALAAAGSLALDAPRAKLAGALLAARSLEIDEAEDPKRDAAVWKELARRLNFPRGLTLARAKQALAAKSKGNDSGDAKSLAALEALVGSEVLQALGREDVGRWAAPTGRSPTQRPAPRARAGQ